MATPTITDYLKYANLQMAAEAFLVRDDGTVRDDIVAALMEGNKHALRFTETQATAFSAQWKVVAQKANTPTGFSGTLFQSNSNSNEYVISFRSTEFIDDAIRDSMATNSLEIFDTGFAWGQLADMEDWYAAIKSQIPDGAQLNVTGYSLCGHLATAFNLLRQQELAQGPQRIAVSQVVTFNGAGVGKMNTGTLAEALAEFKSLRGNPEQLKTRLFSLPELATLYDSLQPRLDFAGKTAEQAKAATEAAILDVQNLRLASPIPDEVMQTRLDAEKRPLLKALNDMLAMQNEAIRIQGFIAGGTGTDASTSPAKVLPANILAETLDYRLAVGLVAERTKASGLAGEIVRHVSGNKEMAGSLANQFDEVGTETTTSVWSAVANSQWHYGSDVKVFIEDQPFTRGNITELVVKDLFDQGAIKLLQNQYGLNNFADTHSLVLIVDSLNIQNALLQLVPEAERAAQTAKMTTYLMAASALKAESASGTQGKAEGDVLETVLDSLVKIFTHTDSRLSEAKTAQNVGLETSGTWADKDLRKNFYEKLALLNDKNQSAFVDLAGKFKLGLPNTSLADAARTDFASLLTLISLSPIAIQAKAGEEDAIAAALGTRWSAEYTAWQDDQFLTPAELSNNRGNYTDQYLTDRAAFLTGLSAARLDNTGEGKNLRTDTGGEAIYFEDKTSGLTVQTRNSGSGQGISGPNVRFGDASNDAFDGADEADHLYGGAGMDSLDGGKGDDYLEGNADNDTLPGGDGSDLLRGDGNPGNNPDDTPAQYHGNDRLDGGAGDDTLCGGDEKALQCSSGRMWSTGKNGQKRNVSGPFCHGGTGNDTLTGGNGTNIYRFTPGSGQDRILPTAGELATLVFDGMGADGLVVWKDGEDLMVGNGEGDGQKRSTGRLLRSTGKNGQKRNARQQDEARNNADWRIAA